jgi:hypothetical protein
MGNDSECNPPMEEDGTSTVMPEMIQNQPDAIQCPTSKQSGLSSTGSGIYAGTEVAGFETSSCSYEKYEYHEFEYHIACDDRPLLVSTDGRQESTCAQNNRSLVPKWVTSNSEHDNDGEGLISCQLSTDFSVDLMSTLSVTEGPISLTSSVTSTASSCYTPRRQRILGSTEATSKSRKLHSGDAMRGKDRMRYSSAGNTTIVGTFFQKVDKNVAELSHSEPYSQANRSDQDEVGLGCNSIAEVSRLNCLQHSDCGVQIYPRNADLPLVISESEDVQLLYERAMAAEYENKQLRNKIEALELECNLLRSSSNITGKEILGVLSHLEDGNDASKSLFELKCSDELQAMRFSRSPYAQQSATNFGDEMSLHSRDLFDPFQSLRYDSFKDTARLALRSTDENGVSASVTRAGEQPTQAFSRGYTRNHFVSRGVSWMSMTEGMDSGELGPPALFFKRMSNITSTYSTLHSSQPNDARDIRSEEQSAGMVNPSFSALQARSSATYTTLEQRQADLALAAQYHVDLFREGSEPAGRARSREGSEQLVSVIGPKEQFFISPNALEASLYNVRGDSVYRSHHDARQDAGGTYGSRDGADPGGRWLEAGAEVGPREAQAGLDPSLFMIV